MSQTARTVRFLNNSPNGADFSISMKIFLNGQPHELTTQMTVRELLVSIGFGEKPCVVELDEEPVFPRDYSTATLVAGAKVEVVTLAAGG